MIEPRIAWVPDCARSLGPDCVEFWRSAGGILFDWQAFVIKGMLGLGEDGRWVSSEDGLNVARQNGKGVILQAIEAFTAFELGYDVVMHTAHEFATSQEHQLRLEAMIQDCPHLHARVKERGGYMHANGRESINLKSGARIIFKARTKGGGRGYSGDLLVWDEAMVVPDTVVGAQKPMLRASRAPHGSKTIYAGSAVDQQVHEYGVPFARIRKRGRASDPRVSYHEWSAPFDNPDEMTAELLRDRTFWPMANPSMDEGLISAETMADEIESMPLRTAAVELDGVGDWPVVDQTSSGLFDMAHWASLARPSTELMTPVLSLDLSPLRTWASISAASGMRVRVVERREGTGWLVDALEGASEELGAKIIVVDERGPASSLIPELEGRGLTVQTVNGSEYARACGFFFDAVAQSALEHEDQPELNAAIRGAAQRQLGDAWAWSRKESRADITSLVSCTLACWVAASNTSSPLIAWEFA